MSKTRLSTISLIFITFLSAIQYIFLKNVPDTVGTFSFLCVTNLIGFLLLSCSQFKKLRGIQKKTILKGILLSLELLGFNFFLLLGSRNVDSVIISSVVSMYFVFVTPLLLLFRKKVNFFSGVATVVAIISLVLLFEVDTEKFFASQNIIYLVLSDIFFALYVVSVSILGEKEDSIQLTISQMMSGVLFSFLGWIVENLTGNASFTLPSDVSFWMSACFIGVFIRGLYGIIQISSQKYVPAISISLIFSSEILITLLINPILCNIFHMEYTPITVHQIIGCVLFIVANLFLNEKIAKRMGYEDLEIKSIKTKDGKTVQFCSVFRKILLITLSFSMATLIISMVICLSAIQFIRSSAVEHSTTLGQEASKSSAEALTQELEHTIRQTSDDKAKLAEAKLETYSVACRYAASYAVSLFEDAGGYPEKEVQRQRKENYGILTMQRTIAEESIDYESLKEESKLLGNMVDVFDPIFTKNENITTIYLGTKDGLLISYDKNSNDTNGEEDYYEFRESDWYNLGKGIDGYAFTDTYQDSYGRGLTITCVSPIKMTDGTFIGCMAMDILMKDLNETMVNDGIFDPNSAILIDNDGNVIASKDVSADLEETYNVLDESMNSPLLSVGREIIEKKDGITSIGSENDQTYISYATIDSTGWIMCIISPAYSVLKPAYMLSDSITESTQNVVASVVEGILIVVKNCLVLLALIILIVVLMTGRFSRKIADPLKKLEKDVQNISSGDLSQRTSVDTNDEIGILARSFNDMARSIQKYITDIKAMTVKEEKLAMEMSVATKIQADMLPNDFPAFPDKKEFNIFATMNPAKEVGGDFYDFFLIDDAHLGMVIADVSGKGVPAALFMVIAKTLIKTRALMGGTPAEILADVNNQLCERNKEGFFVTVWMSILDLKTGKGIESNAGHEYPAIRRKNGDYELIQAEHSIALATMEEIPFRQNEFELHPGDRLFVYTDGVPEATNAENELFGTDRMLASLNSRKDSSLNEILKGLKQDIDKFVGDAPQFDDVTMLGIDYYGAGSDEK